MAFGNKKPKAAGGPGRADKGGSARGNGPRGSTKPPKKPWGQKPPNGKK